MVRIWRARAVALIASTVALTVSPASAQTQQQLDWCINKDSTFTPDLRIRGCMAAIKSGKYTGKHLEWVFNNRGTAYYEKGQYDRAIADFNEAIRLDPKKAPAFSNRGTAYYDKGQYDRAIADYNEAIRLDPKKASAFQNRGNSYRQKGDLDHAIADYNEAIRLDPKDAAAAEAKRKAEAEAKQKADEAKRQATKVETKPKAEATTEQNPTTQPKEQKITEQNPSRWDHNGSVVSLVSDGAKRKILYDAPRIGLMDAGVKPGTVLFEGQIKGQAFVGNAYLFYRTCKPMRYAVSGNTSEDRSQITLKGKAPVVDLNCNVTGSREDVLIFTASQSAPSEPAKDAQAAAAPVVKPATASNAPAAGGVAPPEPAKDNQVAAKPNPDANAAKSDNPKTASVPAGERAPPPPPEPMKDNQVAAKPSPNTETAKSDNPKTASVPAAESAAPPPPEPAKDNQVAAKPNPDTNSAKSDNPKTASIPATESAAPPPPEPSKDNQVAAKPSPDTNAAKSDNPKTASIPATESAAPPPREPAKDTPSAESNTVKPDEANNQKQSKAPEKMMEIVLKNGRILRVGRDIDLEALLRIIDGLER